MEAGSGRHPLSGSSSAIESTASSAPGNFARARHARLGAPERASSPARAACARTRKTDAPRRPYASIASIGFVLIQIGLAKRRSITIPNIRQHHRQKAC